VNTRDAHTILLKPIVSEKGYDAQGKKGKYQFEVLRDATKVEVKNAVEKLFKVHVVSVNVMNQHGKRRRLRAREGFTGDWKKAIVTLQKDEHIDFFERV
jgi:large subunit ribosomal protein L23